METERKIIPLSGYLQSSSEVQPSPPAAEKSFSGYIIAAVAVFIAGLAIGAISIHQSANYQQIQQLKAESAELAKIRKSICRY